MNIRYQKHNRKNINTISSRRSRKKTIQRVIIVDIITLIAIIAMFCVMKLNRRDAFTYKGDYKTLSLQGKWYMVDLDTIYVIDMNDDGKYTKKDMNGNKVKSGTYEIGNYKLKFDNTIYSMNYVDEKEELKDKIGNEDISDFETRRYFEITDNKSEKMYCFANKLDASDQVEDNCTTNKYYEKIKMFDDAGFAIDGDGILLAYTGTAGEVTIPDTVVEIAENAISADYNRAVSTVKMTIPGTVKKIDSGAFSFSHVSTVYIQTGVEEIDQWAFGDSDIKEIHFPESITTIQPGIFDTEEGLDGLKIYCKQGSQVDQYFQSNKPTGKYKIIYE